jgi:ADP-heptose:LPS heptosyltransferase
MSLNLSQRVLIIGPSNVGDAILASPAVERLRYAYPGAHFTLVAGDRAGLVFTEDPRIQSLVSQDLYDSAAGRIKLALLLWRYRPHVVLDLRGTGYPLFLKPWSAWRYLRRPPAHLVHARDRHLWKLAAQVPNAASGATPLSAGSQADSTPGWSLRFSSRDAAHAETLWRRWGFDAETRVVVICPGARSHIKRWTAAGFAQVADRLIQDHGVRVILSGEPDEKEVIDEVQRGMRERAQTSIGLTTIRQLGLLMRRACLVITNDSASLHLASAMGVPTVAAFGPTDDRKYGPTSARRQVLRRRLLCAPCELSRCRFNHECMRFLSAEEVYRAATQLLGHVPVAA